MKLDDLVESYFATQDDKELFTLANLNVLYEEALEDVELPSLVEEKGATQSAAEKFVLSLPKFSPSEAWGDPNSEARKQLTALFQTQGGGASLEGKLKFLERLQHPDSRITSPRRIISTLILMESLSACVNAFGASTAGFIFEGFLAALLGGHQVSEVKGGTLPIEDIVAFSTYSGDKQVKMSLKLLKETTNIKGSYKNLVNALNETPKMVYVIAYKEGGEKVEEIKINTFDLSQETFLLLMDQSDKNRKLLTLPDDVLPEGWTGDSLSFLRSRDSWEELYPYLQQTQGYGRRAKAMAKPEEGEEALNVDDREELMEGAGGTQWYINLKQLNGLGPAIGWGVSEGEQHPVATLRVSPDALYKTAEKYMKHLNESIRNLFVAVQDLSQNVNAYFISKKRGPAIAKGNEAIANAQTIETELSEQTKDTEDIPDIE
jgi:hypothetical protein